MHWHLEGKECCIRATNAANTQHPTSPQYLDTKGVKSVSITVSVGSHLSAFLRKFLLMITENVRLCTRLERLTVYDIGFGETGHNFLFKTMSG